MSYLNDIFGLEGKTAVVAGGAGIIGTVMSGALLNAGANVVIWSRTQASVDQALEKLATSREISERIVGKRVDTTAESEVSEALASASASFDPPGILINAVGGNIGKSPLIETQMDQFEEVMRLNLIAGLMVPTKVFGAYWIENKIINVVGNLQMVSIGAKSSPPAFLENPPHGIIHHLLRCSAGTLIFANGLLGKNRHDAGFADGTDVARCCQSETVPTTGRFVQTYGFCIQKR